VTDGSKRWLIDLETLWLIETHQSLIIINLTM
jgi:hypothetical protein